MRLSDRLRPAQWSQVIAQTGALARIEQLRANGLGGRAYWISGPSGTGKTTIASLIAADLADADFVEEIDAGQLDSATMDNWESTARLYGWGKGGRAYIVNEAHGLRAPIIRRLLVWLERLPNHVAVIFTTTVDGMTLFEDTQLDSSPLITRCECIPMAQRNLCGQFAAYCVDVAQREGLANGHPRADMVKTMERVLKDSRNSLRAALAAVEGGILL